MFAKADSNTGDLKLDLAADTPIEPGMERRRAHRRRTLREAKAILSDRTLWDCLVRDVTEDGANLAFGDVATLPSEFRLLVVTRRTVRPVRVLWQRGAEVGVAFNGPEEPAPGGPSRLP